MQAIADRFASVVKAKGGTRTCGHERVRARESAVMDTKDVALADRLLSIGSGRMKHRIHPSSRFGLVAALELILWAGCHRPPPPLPRAAQIKTPARAQASRLSVPPTPSSDSELLRRLRQSQRLVKILGGTNAAPSWSPDGKRIAVIHRSGSRTQNLMIVTPDGSRRKVVGPAGPWSGWNTLHFGPAISWSPSGDV